MEWLIKRWFESMTVKLDQHIFVIIQFQDLMSVATLVASEADFGVKLVPHFLKTNSSVWKGHDSNPPPKKSWTCPCIGFLTSGRHEDATWPPKNCADLKNSNHCYRIYQRYWSTKLYSKLTSFLLQIWFYIRWVSHFTILSPTDKQNVVCNAIVEYFKQQ